MQVNWVDIENCAVFLLKELPDIKINKNFLLEEIRTLNVYLIFDKLEKWENQNMLKLIKDG